MWLSARDVTTLKMYKICYELAARGKLVENRNAGPDCEMGRSQGDLRSADGESRACRELFRYSVDHYFRISHTGRRPRLAGALRHHSNATKDGTLHLTLQYVV
jgi:hypothetical protein